MGSFPWPPSREHIAHDGSRRMSATDAAIAFATDHSLERRARVRSPCRLCQTILGPHCDREVGGCSGGESIRPRDAGFPRISGLRSDAPASLQRRKRRSRRPWPAVVRAPRGASGSDDIVVSFPALSEQRAWSIVRVDARHQLGWRSGWAPQSLVTGDATRSHEIGRRRSSLLARGDDDLYPPSDHEQPA